MKPSNEKAEALIRTVSEYCATYLNEEFQAVCEKVILKLARKKTRPLDTGSLKVWAAAVVHAVCTVNFVFDKSAEIYLRTDSVAAYFGCATSTMENRSKEIRTQLKMRPLDPAFATSTNRNSSKARGVRADQTLSDITAFFTGKGKIRPETLPLIEKRRNIVQTVEWEVVFDCGPELEYTELEAKLKALGPTKASERSLRDLIERHPEFAPTYDSLAYVLEYQGMDEDAKAVRAKKPKDD